MYRTGDNLSAFGALQSFNEQLGKHLRIAAIRLWNYGDSIIMCLWANPY